jgi:hypothetical protein
MDEEHSDEYMDDTIQYEYMDEEHSDEYMDDTTQIQYEYMDEEHSDEYMYDATTIHTNESLLEWRDNRRDMSATNTSICRYNNTRAIQSKNMAL